VVVHALPVAKFSFSNVCDGSVVQFSDMSTILATDTLQSWSWNFGDGSPVYNNQNSSHLFPAAGSYPVELFVVSNFGCKDSITKTSIINPNPVVNFAANDTIGCEPLCISFLNSSTILSGGNIKWAWVLGDGNSINNSQSFDHCYINDSVFAANFYTVTLTVTSDSGCVSALSKNNYITVYPNPNANFTVQPKTAVITNPVISISDLSTGADFWNWNFGDGSDTTNLSDPLPYTYADTGTYTITLITSTQYNCIDTAYQTIIIEPDFVFYIPNAFTPDGDGINETFSGQGIFIKDYEMTIFDRWGNLIFFSDDINKPWDGKINGGSETAQVDVYVYVVKITGFNRSKHIYRGIVTLVR
jgi:gliding motility-associated-like protein